MATPQIDLEMTPDAKQAVGSADAIYADTWVSMGQEEQTAQRRAAFAGYQINAELLAAAPEHAIVMHCLPAYRNVEITDEVIDGPAQPGSSRNLTIDCTRRRVCWRY